MQELEQVLSRQQESFAAVLENHPTLRQALAASGGLAVELRKLWIASDYAAAICVNDPDILADLLLSGDLERRPADGVVHLSQYLLRLPSPADGDSRARLRHALRCYRKREMLRLIWRDLVAGVDLMETCEGLSLLADTCIAHALEVLNVELREQHGLPLDSAGQLQQLIVLAMGKYGARELNLSSDIDLILVFPEAGETTVTADWLAQHPKARPTTIQHYFSKLGQLLINALDTVTPDGFVFRVDMRLRPYGNDGSLALSIDAIEEYYHAQGRDWERFAMIKVRPVTGDAEQGARLLTILRAFSYRRYLDFATIDALRDLKRQIEQQVRRKGMHDNIKLGRGGIREIEFIVQVLQLIYGGRHTHLQTPSILAALDGLVLERSLQAADAAALRSSYFFLRRLEHALQALQDKQTHAYPQDALSEYRVALSLGLNTAEQLRSELDKVRDLVAASFADLIADPDTDSAPLADAGMQEVWLGRLDAEKAAKALSERGFQSAAEVVQTLTTWRHSRHFLALEKSSRERLDRFMPLLLSRLGGTDNPDVCFARVLAFVQAVAQRTAYLVLLLENPLALEQLLKLCCASPWVAELLARHPFLLDELLRPLTQPPDKPQLQDLLRQQLLRSPADTIDEQLGSLQNFRQEQVLTVAAAELAGTMPLMKVSDYLTWVAEVVLAHVLDLAWQLLTAKYGVPVNNAGHSGERHFIVIGYGKLGGIEVNYGSDLDLVFMHDGHPDLDSSGGSGGALNSGAFYVQLGQKVLSLLSTHTLAGKLYEIDMRLRPSGSSGALVSTAASFLKYQLESAWTWEHQALVRARVVAGSDALGVHFERIRNRVLGKQRVPEELRRDIVSMRLRMRRELGSKRPLQTFHLKQDAGGLVDIEFIVQYLVLAHAHQHAQLLEWTDNMRLLDTAAACGVIAAEDAKALQQIYIGYRTLLHHLALDKAAYLLPGTEFSAERQRVTAIWDTLFAGVVLDASAASSGPELQ